ncbi:D-xylose-proton symporter-like 3, chloroplastic [Morella rubra]|uniref:D-xylose-proton symporter-like 3, chloroplastic n=1 Tax=Morella rubra TaxID=262757 RepID=A0A6A1UFJ7_9ROSI|nr:D-xylose-proton symporter-like 3, chloroplastic [Morella rubra]
MMEEQQRSLVEQQERRMQLMAEQMHEQLMEQIRQLQSLSLKELFIVLGILLGYFVGSFQIDVVGGWRYMFGVSAPVALIMGLGMWSLPPSPRWLLLRAVQRKGLLEDYKDKAILALSKLRGRPPGDKLSERQIEDNVVSLKSAYADQDSEGSFLEVFQGPSLKAFIIGGGLVLFQQSESRGHANLKIIPFKINLLTANNAALASPTRGVLEEFSLLSKASLQTAAIRANSNIKVNLPSITTRRQPNNLLGRGNNSPSLRMLKIKPISSMVVPITCLP